MRSGSGHAQLAALCLGGVLLAVNRTILYPLLDRVGQELHLTAAQAGMVSSVYFTLLIVSQVVLGLAGDRVGLKRSLVASYLLAAGAVLALGLWTTNYATLLLFVGLEGLGMGVFWPAAYSLTVSSVPEGKRGRASAVVTAGLAGGHALGPAISGVLFRVTGGWRLPFVFMSIPTALLAIAFIFVLQESGRDPADSPPASWAHPFRDRRLVGLFVAAFCSLYGFWIVVVWGPAFLQAERGMSVTGSGLYTALVTAFAVPAGLAVGPLSDRIGRRQISWVMLAISAAMMGLLAVVTSHWALFLILAVYGLVGKFAWDPVLIAWLADIASRDRAKTFGQVLSLASIIGMLSSVVGPVVNGWIRDRTGSLQGAFFLGMLLALIGTMICLRMKEGTPEALVVPATVA